MPCQKTKIQNKLRIRWKYRMRMRKDKKKNLMRQLRLMTLLKPMLLYRRILKKKIRLATIYCKMRKKTTSCPIPWSLTGTPASLMKSLRHSSLNLIALKRKPTINQMQQLHFKTQCKMRQALKPLTKKRLFNLKLRLKTKKPSLLRWILQIKWLRLWLWRKMFKKVKSLTLPRAVADTNSMWLSKTLSSQVRKKTIMRKNIWIRAINWPWVMITTRPEKWLHKICKICSTKKLMRMRGEVGRSKKSSQFICWTMILRMAIAIVSKTARRTSWWT